MTPEEIRAQYEPQIAAAGDDELAALRLTSEMNSKIAESYSGSLRQREVADLKREAIGRYPRARIEDLQSDDPAEIEARAKASHEHVESIVAGERERIKAELEAEMGRRTYGSPTAGSATGAPPVANEALRTVREKLEAKMEEGRPISEAEVHNLLKESLLPLATRVAADLRG